MNGAPRVHHLRTIFTTRKSTSATPAPSPTFATVESCLNQPTTPGLGAGSVVAAGAAGAAAAAGFFGIIPLPALMASSAAAPPGTWLMAALATPPSGEDFDVGSTIRPSVLMENPTVASPYFRKSVGSSAKWRGLVMFCPFAVFASATVPSVLMPSRTAAFAFCSGAGSSTIE